MTDELDTWRMEPDGMVGGNRVVENTVVLTEGVATSVDGRELIVVNNAPDVTVGLGALAMMSDAEFTAKIAMLKRGQERVREIQRSLMERGDDYGVVKGIERPFLHLPGAEKLEKFYGYATEQRTERFVGDGITSPHLAYRTDSYVHLGDVSGPVVAMVSATCNSWEAKYRYVWQKALCPACQHTLIKGKLDGKLKGKFWCSQRDGGCNRTFESNDQSIAAPGKIENTDPWSLDETIMQMAQKRSYVAAVRRATGTSGIFTIDEDSPSVQAQADHSPEGSDDVAISAAPSDMTTSRGGKADQPTAIQISQLSKISKERNLGPAVIAEEIRKLGGKIDLPEGTRGEQGQALLAWINQHLTADELGSLLFLLDTPLPDPADAAAAPDKATN